MTLMSAPLTFMSATLQPQVEDLQNENRKFGSGCEYAIQSLSTGLAWMLSCLPMKGQLKKKVVDPIPSPLDLFPQEPAIEGAIGMLVMRLSFVHFLLEINLCSLLGIDAEKGRILTEDVPFSRLMHRFLRAVKTRNPQPEVLKQFKDLLKGLQETNEKRNGLVHAFWTFPENGPPLLVPKKGKIASVEAPTVNEILEMVNATDRFIDGFFKAMFPINNPHLDHSRSHSGESS
jgi:hypothetical protein